MNGPPIPVVFAPIYKPKPWGGRSLAALFGRSLPPGQFIGESWELVSLPADESRVRDGPLAGRTLSELMEVWGPRLLGGATLVDGRFPLLIKFLDAREPLSVQVHPQPASADSATAQPGVKHEAWYVIRAEPGARLFIGLRSEVTPSDVPRVVNTPELPTLLREWPARVGQCYYLPSGTPHALGAGVVVAEVQTPSDVTYRLYDWGRVDLDGRPRELHVDKALQNLRFDVADGLIAQRRTHLAGAHATLTRLAACEYFQIDKVRFAQGFAQALPHAEMVIWIVLTGRGRLTRGAFERVFAPGEVVLIPADSADVHAEMESDVDLLEVRIPVASPLRGAPHPPPEPRLRPDDPVPLTRGGRPV